MPRRGESVPFAFIADADRFRSNVTPPPRARRTAAEKAGSALFGLTVVAGLAGLAGLVSETGSPLSIPSSRGSTTGPPPPRAADRSRRPKCR